MTDRVWRERARVLVMIPYSTMNLMILGTFFFASSWVPLFLFLKKEEKKLPLKSQMPTSVHRPESLFSLPSEAM